MIQKCFLKYLTIIANSILLVYTNSRNILKIPIYIIILRFLLIKMLKQSINRTKKYTIVSEKLNPFTVNKR